MFKARLAVLVKLQRHLPWEEVETASSWILDGSPFADSREAVDKGVELETATQTRQATLSCTPLLRPPAEEQWSGNTAPPPPPPRYPAVGRQPVGNCFLRSPTPLSLHATARRCHPRCSPRCWANQQTTTKKSYLSSCTSQCPESAQQPQQRRASPGCGESAPGRRRKARANRAQCPRVTSAQLSCACAVRRAGRELLQCCCAADRRHSKQPTTLRRNKIRIAGRRDQPISSSRRQYQVGPGAYQSSVTSSEKS